MIVTPLWFALVFFLPETLRSLVGDGSGYSNPTPLQYWREKRKQQKNQQSDEEKVISYKNQSEMSFDSSITTCYNKTEGYMKTIAESSSIEVTKDEKIDVEKLSKSRFEVLPNLFQSWAYLKEKDVTVILLYNSLQYAGLYCVITSLTELFTGAYGINEFQVGLCFLSNGIGASLGSYTSGRILDWKFKKIAKSLGIDEKNAKR